MCPVLLRDLMVGGDQMARAEKVAEQVVLWPRVHVAAALDGGKRDHRMFPSECLNRATARQRNNRGVKWYEKREGRKSKRSRPSEELHWRAKVALVVPGHPRPIRLRKCRALRQSYGARI